MSAPEKKMLEKGKIRHLNTKSIYKHLKQMETFDTIQLFIQIIFLNVYRALVQEIQHFLHSCTYFDPNLTHLQLISSALTFMMRLHFW